MNIQVSSSIEIKIEDSVFKLSREDAYALFNALKIQLGEISTPIIIPYNPWNTPPYAPTPIWYSIKNT